VLFRSTGLKRNPPKTDAGAVNYFTTDITSPESLKDLATVYFIVSPDGCNETTVNALSTLSSS